MSGAFASAALDLHARGLAVIPTGKADGKSPLVKGWTVWRGQHRSTVEQFIKKHGSANLGVITGLSRLTIVDCDDEKTLADAESLFGESPLVTRSPRGGGHLWFRSNGERCANLRSEGLNIDVKGQGGFVLAPPSQRPNGGLYRLERGTWDELARLPTIKAGSLPDRSAPSIEAPPRLRTVPNGARHNELFTSLLVRAEWCNSLDELVIDGHAINAGFNPPIGADNQAERGDVEKTARSVWRMKMQGRLIVPGREGTLMLHSEHERLDADAFYLLAFIRRQHSKRPDPFALSPKAMEKAQSLPGWGKRRYGMAIGQLMAAKKLIRIHKGGRKKGDPSLYRMGTANGPNVIDTLPSASPASSSRKEA